MNLYWIRTWQSRDVTCVFFFPRGESGESATLLGQNRVGKITMGLSSSTPSTLPVSLNRVVLQFHAEPKKNNFHLQEWIPSFLASQGRKINGYNQDLLTNQCSDSAVHFENESFAEEAAHGKNSFSMIHTLEQAFSVAPRV